MWLFSGVGNHIWDEGIHYVLGGPSYVGDQPRPKKQGRQPLFLLAVSWQQASHAQCVTCDQRRRKRKKACSFFFQAWNREGAGFTAV
jgi:hypothetical protein